MNGNIIFGSIFVAWALTTVVVIMALINSKKFNQQQTRIAQLKQIISEQEETISHQRHSNVLKEITDLSKVNNELRLQVKKEQSDKEQLGRHIDVLENKIKEFRVNNDALSRQLQEINKRLMGDQASKSSLSIMEEVRSAQA